MQKSPWLILWTTHRNIDHTFSTHVRIPEAIETEKNRSVSRIHLRNYDGHTQNLLLTVIPLDVRVNKGNVIWTLWQKLAESLARGAATPTGEKRQYSSRAHRLNQYQFRTLFLKRICAKSYQLHIVLPLISLTCQCKQKHEINQWLLNIIVVLERSNNLL